ncbi:MAG: hypothetical protein JJE04_02610, partial [Acidobacteriia bacterium]|nr:hypothetical protein [Terriglobia bacterium]
VITFPGRNGYGNRLLDWDSNNVSPRFGFNYRMDNQTVIRGGFGIFFGNPFDRNAIQISGLGFDGVGTVRDPVLFTLQQGLPAGTLAFPPASALTSSFGARDTPFAVSQVQFLDPHQSHPAGVAAAHRNPRPPETALHPVRLGCRANTDHLSQLGVVSLSRLHIQIRSEKRLSNGLGWIATYTWSKWIDNLIFTGGDDATFGDLDQIQNIYDLRNECSLSNNHIPYRAVLSPVLEVPAGKGKRWLNHAGPVHWILGGWQLSGIVTLQTGSPFGVSVVNGPRDILGDNSDINFDTGVSKNFRIGERYRVQFRWESFNPFNTPMFGVPGSDLGGGGFGISGAGSSHREMQFALKFYY